MTDSKSTRHSGYIALKRLTFGVTTIEAGQPIPFEEGRNYDAMVRRGQAMLDLQGRHSSQASQPASLEEPANRLGGAVSQLQDASSQHSQALTASIPAGQIQSSDMNPQKELEGYLIGADGGYQKVKVGMVADGQASIQFPDSTKVEQVQVTRLLPVQPTEDLIADLEAQIEDSQDVPDAFGFMESQPYWLVRDQEVKQVFVGSVRLPDEQERAALNLPEGEPVADVRSNPEDPDTDEVVRLTDLVAGHIELQSFINTLTKEDQTTNETAGAVSAGEAAYLVSAAGITTVVVKSFHAANAEDAAQLGIAEDADIAEVTEVDEEGNEGEEPFIVPVADLLPIQTTDKLLKTFGIVDEEGAPIERPDAEYTAALEEENGFLTTLVSAMQLDGAALDSKTTPSFKTLKNAWLTTLEGVKLLAESGGVDYLARVKGFSDKQAQNLYDWLVSEGHVTPPAPEEATEAPAGDTDQPAADQPTPDASSQQASQPQQPEAPKEG